ncbi:Hypoxia up-regulated protein [Erysiphe necator]|uniref:Putative heat shock protein 70-like protein n=1 Tax=Uncinula necator TaxID=52586 RepID=A0A0B1P9L0_UNCNE|nr:Hypoxia up-regulated protein [Erysiphe necator]KHJ33651.1 putative heat shock protein 70-like protein [Erysiphe necator]
MFYNPSLAILCLIYSFNFLSLAASAVIGIDLGTEYIKATIVKPGIPLDIVLTKDSRRKELSAIAFKPEKNLKSGKFPERVYGSDAMALASRFPGDVYPNLKVLLGHGTENSIVKEYALRHPKLKVETQNVKGTAAFKSEAFLAEEISWTVEEILAMELQNVQKNAQALAGKGSSIKDCVITIPPFYTIEEKRAILLAANLAGLHVLELISDGLAVGINYATTRTFSNINNGGKAETHLIFDMGAGSTKASVLKFQGRTVKDIGRFNKTIQEIKVLGNGWDRTLGGNLFNSLIVNDMVTQFMTSPAAKKKSINAHALKNDGKVMAKLEKEAEKSRQILSANANTQTFFEGLYEDIDFKYKITRVEFEKMAEAHVGRISQAIQKALDAAGLRIKDLDSVILHGGASRTPFVQRELERFIGDVNKLKTNVNSDESAVFGAGFRGATLSPSFRVKEIRVYDCMNYPSGVKWTNVHGKIQHQGLWKAASYFGDEKRYEFKNQDDPFALTFYQRIPLTENLSSGTSDHETLIVTTQNLTNSVTYLKEKHGCLPVDITVRLSAQILADSGEVLISKLVAGCEVEASEKESMVDSVKGLFGFGKKDQLPISDGEISESATTTPKTSEITSTLTTESVSSPSKDATQKSTKTRKVTEIIHLNYMTEIKGRPQLPASEISRMKERLAAFSSSDNLRRLRDEALNQLESFTYKVRDLLDEPDFIAASTEQERTTIESKSKDTSDWIYSGGTEASREEFRERLQDLQEAISPIEFRKTETVNRPAKILSMQSALKETKQLILTITEQIANDTKEHTVTDLTSQSLKPTESPSVEELVSPEEQKKKSTTTPTPQSASEPPAYTEADLITLQRLFDEYSSWLEEKLVNQEKLKVNENPVLICNDLEEKTKSLQEANIRLLVKNMQRLSKVRNSMTKTKYKSHESTDEAEKSIEAESSSKTTDIPRATFTFGDESVPSEAEMQEHLRKLESHKEGKVSESDKKKKQKKESNSKHVEL